MNGEDRLRKLLSANRSVMDDLKTVRSLTLPQGCVGAGYVRNLVWDHLHGYSGRTPLNDIDVLYYDANRTEESEEVAAEQRLKEMNPKPNWSVKNQARMHLRNREDPYVSIADAMKRWPETATAVAIYLDQQDEIVIVAPYGLSDLFELKVRKCPLFASRENFEQRIRNKNWLALWPKLTIVDG